MEEGWWTAEEGPHLNPPTATAQHLPTNPHPTRQLVWATADWDVELELAQLAWLKITQAVV